MITISTYRYLVNAHFVKGQLLKHNISSELREMSTNEQTVFEILVGKNDLNMAKGIISNLKIDDTEVSSQNEDYLKEYKEWSDNMYNPGHYTGGKIPHFLMDKTNWKFIGPFFFIIGLGLAFIMVRHSSGPINIETAIWIGMYVLAGASMIWQLNRQK
jgi:hypothetical protein